MAYGTVNSPGAMGADLAAVQATANSAMTKANSNESEISKVKATAESALSKANEAKVTGIKGSAESTYRTGQVNISAADTGAAAANHVHNYAGSSSAGGAATTALSCTGNSATATKANQDSAGQQINTTYIKGLSVSGLTITYTKGSGTTDTVTLQGAVEQEVSSKIRRRTSAAEHFNMV